MTTQPTLRPKPATNHHATGNVFTGLIHAGRCTAAVSAAINAAGTWPGRRELLRLLDRAGDTTHNIEQMSAVWLRSPQNPNRWADQTRTALTALQNTAAACPCPVHTWHRAVPGMTTLIGGHLDRIWIITGPNETTYQAGIDAELLQRHIPDDDMPFHVTVTWTTPTLTITYLDTVNGEATTVTCQALNDTQTRHWEQWTLRDDTPAGYDLAAEHILTADPAALDRAPVVFDAIRAAGTRPAYTDVVAAITDTGWAPSSPGEIAVVTGLADKWEHSITDLLGAAQNLAPGY